MFAKFINYNKKSSSPGNIVALALILTATIMMVGIGVGMVVMQGLEQSRNIDK